MNFMLLFNLFCRAFSVTNKFSKTIELEEGAILNYKYCLYTILLECLD